MKEFSLIIPTYRRKESLVRLLRVVLPMVKNKGEIIIVEQGEDNGAVYRLVAKEYNEKIVYIFEKTVSTSLAKNIGAKAAKGKYFIFYDDDVVPEPHAIEAMVADFSDETVGGIAGRATVLGKPDEIGNMHVGRISALGTFSDGFSSKVSQDVETVIGCNMAWRREAFEKVHGFDERFTGNAMREESDLSLRVKKAGYRIVFEPESAVVHLREPQGGARKKDNRLFWYFHFFSNEVYFFLKHRPAFLLPLFLCLRLSYVLRCMFGFGREVSVRSMTTPVKGILDGIKKWKEWKK